MNGAIIGAGISGLATSIALQKNGLSVTVYEAAQKIKSVGAGIILPPNAIQILDRYGLAQQIIQAGNALDTFVVLTPQEKILSTVPAKVTINSAKFQAIAIQRSKLQDILVSALPENSIQTNKSCDTVSTVNTKNKVTFNDGSNIECDYLIAADGLNSTVRRCIFPDSKLRYSGQTCWRGTANFTLAKKSLAQFTEVWGNGIIFGYVAVSSTQVYWFISTNSPATLKQNLNLTKLDIVNRFSSQHPLLTELVLNTKHENIIHNDLYDLTPLKFWFNNATVLSGDAAHASMPNLGQGGAQALEDSWILAEELSKTDDVRHAFSQYQTRRQKRTQKIVQNSLMLSKVAHLSNKPLCFMRDFLLQKTPAFITRQQAHFLYTV